MSEPDHNIEHTASMLELLSICRDSPTEREKLRAKITTHMEEERKSILETVARTHTESLLAALTHEQQRRLNRYTEELFSDFGSYHRYILSIAIAKGLPGRGPFHSAQCAMHAMLYVLPELYEAQSFVLMLDAIQGDDGHDGMRVDHILLARIQSEFETDVRLGHHEMQFIQGIFDRTDAGRLVRLVGFDPEAAQTVINRVRESVDARLDRAFDAANRPSHGVHTLVSESFQDAYRMSIDDIATTDKEKEFVKRLSVTVGEEAMGLPWPRRDAPVRRRAFLRCQSGEVMALNLGGLEHSVRAYIEQELAADNSVFQKYRKAKNNYIEHRGFHELARLIGSPPTEKNYYIKDTDGNFKERDALWFGDDWAVVLEVKDMSVREPAQTIEPALIRRRDDLDKSLGAANRQAESVAKQLRRPDGELAIYSESGTLLRSISTKSVSRVFKVVATGDDFRGDACNPQCWLDLGDEQVPWVIDVFSLALVGCVFREKRRDFIDYLDWRLSSVRRFRNADELEVCGCYATHGRFNVPGDGEWSVAMEYADVFDICYYRSIGIPIEYPKANSKPVFTSVSLSKDRLRTRIGRGPTRSTPVGTKSSASTRLKSRQKPAPKKRKRRKPRR